MSTKTALAFDLVTMVRAIRELDNFLRNTHQWIPGGQQSSIESQKRFIGLMDKFGADTDTLAHIKALASNDFDELNRFLIANGFPEMFRGGRGGYGAVAILDMLVKWAFQASDTTMYGELDNGTHTSWKGFKIKAQNARIFGTTGRHHPVVQLRTTDGGSVFVVMTDKPTSGLDLFDLASECMNNPSTTANGGYDTVVLPNVSIDTPADVSWLPGIDNIGGGCQIDEAFQLLRITMDSQGASAQVASGVGSRSLEPMTRDLKFNAPFAGWFTQPGSNIPLAPFYADKSTWVQNS